MMAGISVASGTVETCGTSPRTPTTGIATALGYLDDTLTILARIAVDITLVAGNHDRCHPYNGARGERFIDLYRDKCNLADLLLTNTRLTLANDGEVLVSHFPYAESNPKPQ